MTISDADYGDYAEDMYDPDFDPDDFDEPDEWDDDDGLTDVEADAMTLRDAGWGTDEDYGMYEADPFDY